MYMPVYLNVRCCLCIRCVVYAIVFSSVNEKGNLCLPDFGEVDLSVFFSIAMPRAVDHKLLKTFSALVEVIPVFIGHRYLLLFKIVARQIPIFDAAMGEVC